MLGISELQDPSSVTEARSWPNSGQWIDAMMESLNQNNVWKLVEHPPQSQGDQKQMGF